MERRLDPKDRAELRPQESDRGARQTRAHISSHGEGLWLGHRMRG